MTDDLTRLNKLAIARQVRAFRARPANRALRHKHVVEAFEAAWGCSHELSAEQIAHAAAFVEVVLREDDARIERGKREICADIAAGTVPVDVTEFAELHDHVDANYYGGLFETDLDGDELLNVGIIVQDALAGWMLQGGHRRRRKGAPK